MSFIFILTDAYRIATPHFTSLTHTSALCSRRYILNSPQPTKAESKPLKTHTFYHILHLHLHLHLHHRCISKNILRYVPPWPKYHEPSYPMTIEPIHRKSFHIRSTISYAHNPRCTSSYSRTQIPQLYGASSP